MNDDRELGRVSPTEPVSLELERKRAAELERLIEEQRADMVDLVSDDESTEEVRLLDITRAYEKEALRMYKAGRRNRMTSEDLP